MEHPQNEIIDKHSPEHLTKEQEPLLGLDETLGQIDKAIKDLDRTNLTPDQQLRLKKIKKSVIGSTKNFLGVARKVAAIGAIIGLLNLGVETIDYIMTHPDVQETTSQSGEIIYVHPDERTTHYLNILAGRDKFTDEDLKFAHENNRTAKELNILAGREKFTDEDMYGLVWKLEEEGGNPRIRFTAEDAKRSLRPLGFENADKYSIGENTLYIAIDSLIDGYGVVSEMSHAKQFTDNPLGAHFLKVRDHINVFLKSGFSKKGQGEAYGELYNTPGSLEYQAHKVIMPDLEDRYNLPYPEQQKDGDNK